MTTTLHFFTAIYTLDRYCIQPQPEVTISALNIHYNRYIHGGIQSLCGSPGSFAWMNYTLQVWHDFRNGCETAPRLLDLRS